MSDDTSDLKSKIEKIEHLKDSVLRHTTILTDNLQIVSPHTYGSSQDTAIRNVIREIRTVINELNKLKPYCDEKSKKRIELYADAGAELTRYTTSKEIYYYRSDIEHWATKTIGISFDYDKYPFHISSGLEYEWKDLKFFIEMSYDRLGFPGGWKGGLAASIVLIGLIFGYIFFQLYINGFIK